MLSIVTAASFKMQPPAATEGPVPPGWRKICAVARDGDRWRLGALSLLGFLAPFNIVGQPDNDLLRQPLVALALVIGAVVAVSAWNTDRHLPRLSRWMLGLSSSWIILLWAVALLSPDRWVSAGAAARFSVAAILMIATALTVKDKVMGATILRAIVTGAVLAVILGALVQLTERDISEPFGFFGDVTRLGPYDRLTRPWSHANVAAMAIGATIAGVAVVRTRWVRLVAASVLVVGMVLTYSRGGVLSLALGAIVWLGIRWRSAKPAAPERVALGALTALAIVVALLLPGWAARTSGQDQLAWWQADLDVPASVQLGAEPVLLSIGVTNNGSVVWPRAGDEPVLISARWVEPDTTIVRAEHRWKLPQDLAPGERIDADVLIDTSVPNGEYQIHWDLLIDNQAYFRQFAGLPASISTGQVNESQIDDDRAPAGSLITPRQLPGRTEIWSAAIDAFVDDPIAGVGPGRLRESMPTDARSAHGHNLVLEPLATWGLFATLPFLALIFGALAISWKRALRYRDDTFDAALAVGLTIVVAHGMVDWSLIHVGVAIPMGVLLGLAWTEDTVASGPRDA